MADNADEETDDETLSATLTEALGLLEQDYEDELSASQILDKHKVREAFAAHRKDEH